MQNFQALPIFAGVSSTGELKFVGDVPRGAACGCTCFTCGAPLVARRGEIRAWHFAHEASQERPDCFAGAVNLLRTLVIHRLQATGLPPLPTYWASVSTKFPLRRLEETIACVPGAATVEAWEANPTQTGATALLRLASGTGVRLFVAVGPNAQLKSSDVRHGEGVVIFEVPLPNSADQLQDMATAIRHIDRTGSMVWRHFPDAAAAKAEALVRLEAAAKVSTAGTEKWEPSWVQPRALPAFQYVMAQPLPAPAPPAQEHVDESPWAALRKPQRPFRCYGQSDGTGWVLFMHKDGREIMAPYPNAYDGWDEAMPRSIAIPDPDLSVYVVADLPAASIFLGRLAPMLRMASSWSEVLALPWPRPG